MKPALLPHGNGTADSSLLPLDVRVSTRARRAALRVSPAGRVELVIPRGADPRALRVWVESQRPWIERTLRRIAAAPAHARPEQIELRALNETWRLDYQHTSAARTRLEHAEPGRLILRGAVDDTAACHTLLRRWVAQHAHAPLQAQLHTLSALTGLRHQQLRIRRQRTLWGSCTRGGAISLNCKLLFLPAPLVRYVLIHELCHTRHLNHSARFWALVARHQPDYHTLRVQLRQAGPHVPFWME